MPTPDSGHDENFAQKGDRIKIELTEPLDAEAEIIVKFGNELCTDWSVVESTIFCDFQGGVDFTSDDCQLSVNIINFGNVFISDELKENCLIHVPTVGQISNNRLGTEGGAKVYLTGKFSNLDAEKTSISLKSQQLAFSKVKSDGIEIEIPGRVVDSRPGSSSYRKFPIQRSAEVYK